jgi:pimeloyl-ACP methyl ester carboxylesterase
MKLFSTIFGWILSVVFFILFIITLSLGRFLPASPFLIICIIISPWFGKLFKKKGVKIAMYFVRTIFVVVLLFGFLVLSVIHIGKQPLYKSDQYKENLLKIYDSKLKTWPVPHETRLIETDAGKVHVIVCGNEDAPPLLLLHAASMSSWSWLYNVDSLAQNFRIFAIDFIGEPGKNDVTDENKIPMESKSLYKYYDILISELGITGNYNIIAASFGGYIAMNQSIHSPERIGKIALLGPMGLTPATSSVNTKLMLYMLFPVKAFQDKMLNWAMGDDPRVLKETEPWFRLVLNGVNRKGAPPLTFTPEQLNDVKASVLLILGDKDQLVGNPELVKPLAKNVPQIEIKVLASAHLIGLEKDEEVNILLNDFFEK